MKGDYQCPQPIDVAGLNKTKGVPTAILQVEYLGNNQINYSLALYVCFFKQHEYLLKI